MEQVEKKLTSSSRHSVFSVWTAGRHQRRGLKNLNRIILDSKEIMSYIYWDRINEMRGIVVFLLRHESWFGRNKISNQVLVVF